MGKNVVGRLQQTKCLGIAQFGIIRMEARGEKSVDAVNRLYIGIGTDLEKFIIIDHSYGKVLFDL